MTSLVTTIAVEARPPSLADNTADADRLRRALAGQPAAGGIRIALSCLGALAGAFRAAGFSGWAVVNHLPHSSDLVDFLPEKPDILGMALDLGTTHLAAELVDLESGAVLARAGRQNSQIRHGADILSRIHYAASADGLAELHRAVIDDVNILAGELAAAHGCGAGDIRALAVAGNTTMAHLFLHLDPRHICREPYIPVANLFEPGSAAELGIGLHPHAPVWVLPNVGSYFGGDLIAGILATDMWRRPEISMLIDVGTNAEVVIGNRDWLMACAGAAGPALEGGIARMGMRAAPGAIERVTIDPESGRVDIRTIGNAPARGICGSGMIDLAAALYLARIIDIRGKFRPGSHPAVVEGANGPAFRVVDGDETASGAPILLDQIDLDNLIRSKAAMYAILKTLVNQVGIGFEQIRRIHVAGAFGQHINPRNAVILGMLPDLPMEVFEAVGNSSLAGARQILLDAAARRQSMEIGGRITYMELNVNHEFMNRFSGARFIPHTDHTLFPSVPYHADLT